MSDIYYCPKCNSTLNNQTGFNPNERAWTCTSCGMHLMDNGIYCNDRREGVAWYCDNCNTLLNNQRGFSDLYGTWTCTKCGHINGTNDGDIINDEFYSLSSNCNTETGYSNNSSISTTSREYSPEEIIGMMYDAYKLFKAVYTGISPVVKKVAPIVGKFVKESILHIVPVDILYNSRDLVGKKANEVRDRLIANGYTNVELYPVKDVDYDNVNDLNNVISIFVNESPTFYKGETFQSNTLIIIAYHAKKEVIIPNTNEEFKKIKLEQLRNIINNEGFKNITISSRKGLKRNRYKIIYVKINGNTEYKKYDIVTFDTPIEIKYIDFEDSKQKKSDNLQESKRRDRKTHVYVKCPSCQNNLRLPKEKGKHIVVCPCCKNRFKIKI